LPQSRAEVLAWEQRWARPVALVAFASLPLIIAAIVVASQGVGGGNGESELLRNVDAHRSAQVISSILQALGFGLLAAPLYYLFRAAKARSEKMRGQFVGIVVAAPLFLAAAAILTAIVTLHAADQFVANHVPTLLEKGVGLSSDRANEVATNVVTDAPLRSIVGILGLVGALSFVFAMIYTSLYAMRSGLLTRFWGSLGIALGAISLLPFPPFYLIWFFYFGLLLMAWAPGGKPPAWRSGEAEPWPTPGEKAAAAMDDDEPPIEGEDPASLESTERRKRKQRD
jgi:hypothetical protein